MYIKEAHIKIEQGLHNIGVFVYYDIAPEEIDNKINDYIWKMLERDFRPEGAFSVTQGSLDKYQTLIEKEILLSVSKEEDVYVGELPENYYHLIKDSSIVLYECSLGHVNTGKIAKDEWYKVKEGGITYNTVTYNKGDIFKGVDGVAGYVETNPLECTRIIKLKKSKSANRLVEESKLDELNSNLLSRTRYKSPLSTVASNKIFINVLDFYIEKVYISYLRKPSKVKSNFTQYVIGNVLELGKEYEVIAGSVTYNGNIYKANPGYQFDSFTTVTGALTFTGTGIIRLKGDGDIDLPQQVALSVIDAVILDIAATSEQPQQKVNNLAQINNV